MKFPMIYKRSSIYNRLPLMREMLLKFKEMELNKCTTSVKNLLINGNIKSLIASKANIICIKCIVS